MADEPQFVPSLPEFIPGLPKSAPAQATPAGPNAMLTGPMPPEGTPEQRASQYQQMRDYLPGPLKFLTPATAGEAAMGAVQAAIPGGGFVRPAVRGLAALGTGTGVDVALGRDPAEALGQHGPAAVLGEAVGGLGRAGGRIVGAARDKAVPAATAIAERVMPFIRGKTPQDTAARLLDGRAAKALSDDFRDTISGLVTQHGNPTIAVPSLAQLPGVRQNPNYGNGFFDVDDALKQIQNLRGSILKESGHPATTSMAHQKLDLIDKAENELANELLRTWGRRAYTDLVELKEGYAAGKAILKLWNPTGKPMTPGQMKAFVDPSTGLPKTSDLQLNLQAQRGYLEKRLGPDLAGNLDALRIDPNNPGLRDVPGRLPVPGSWGAIPWVKGLTKTQAPRLTMEGQGPEWTSKLGRYLTTRGVGSLGEE